MTASEGNHAIENEYNTAGTNASWILRRRNTGCICRRRRAVHINCGCRNPSCGKIGSLHLTNHLTKEQKIALQIGQHLGHLHPHSTWLELVFCRLGHCASVDLAALALAEALDFHFGGKQDLQRSNAGFVCYGKAVRHLQGEITTPTKDFEDGSLIAVSMLAIFEVMMSSHSSSRQKTIFLHWSGLRSILLSKHPRHLSDVARAVLYSLWDTTFGVAVGLGLASPFDHPRWLSVQPAGFLEMTDYQRKLRKSANSVALRIPRLIQQLRQIREGNSGPAMLQYTTELALSLLELREEDAESRLLHELTVSTTKDTNSRTIIPMSYGFTTPDDFNAGMLNWNWRIAVINASFKLAEIHKPSAPLFDLEKLRKERERASTHTMMCWEYAECIGPFETLWVAKGLLQIWPELRRLETIRPTKYGQQTQDWMLSRMNHPLNEWLSEIVSAEEMDIAADFLVGGPMHGFISDAGTKAQWQGNTPPPVDEVI